MANIVGCEVVSLESYYRSEQVKDFKYDDFSSLDLSLLLKVRLQSLCSGLYPHDYDLLYFWRRRWSLESYMKQWGLYD